MYWNNNLTGTTCRRKLPDMNLESAARYFTELGNPHRLEAFRLLVRAGPAGLTVGELQQSLGIPKSTLSHHCFHLVMTGLVEQRREGRARRCIANCALAAELAGFLVDQCCDGVEIVRNDRVTASDSESAERV